MKPLPPYGKQWLAERPHAGLWVAVGPRAWEFAASKPFPVPLLPPGRPVSDFEWPAVESAALIVDTGDCAETRDELAKALMTAGAPSVVALALSRRDPRIYYTRESAA